MLTGEIRSQIDSIWNDFWSGGVSKPLSVIEQITYLLFIKRLDELHTVEERKAATLKIQLERRIFPDGKDDRGAPYQDLRWSRFKDFEPREMFKIVDEHVFPFLRTLGGEGSAFSEHMKDARLGIPTPALLAKAVEKLDEGLCHIAVRRVAKIRASRNNQTGATAVRHVSIAAARST
jgi:type I restriction enzyme M protein